MVGSGAVRAAVDLPTEALARQILAAGAPGVAEAVERAADRIVAEARERWPVRTGRSRAGLEAVVVVDPGLTTIRGTVVNEVEYARFVKDKQDRSAMTELLAKPIRAATPALIAEIGDRVGGRRG